MFALLDFVDIFIILQISRIISSIHSACFSFSWSTNNKSISSENKASFRCEWYITQTSVSQTSYFIDIDGVLEILNSFQRFPMIIFNNLCSVESVFTVFTWDLWFLPRSILLLYNSRRLNYNTYNCCKTWSATVDWRLIIISCKLALG